MQPAPRFAIAVAVALLVAAVTWGMGWWAVVPVAVVAGWVLRDVRGIAGTTAAGAALGWAMLLGLDALGGRLGALAVVLAGTVGAPVGAVVFVTLAFPAILGWSAAAIGAAVAAAVSGRTA